MITEQDKRLQLLRDWLVTDLQLPLQQLTSLTNDASFRRYFRAHCNEKCYVVMDAPPEKESCEPFVAIAKSFRQLGLNVPVIYAENFARGFLLLTDFGDYLYLNKLNPTTASALYQRALQDLLLIQSCRWIENYTLPKFNAELYYRELVLFRDWYLEKYLGVLLSSREVETLENIYQLLITDALSQPQVCTHRDYHSRNLMVVANKQQPGVLDFQDAVWGPITYDLLSLLRDCYIDWPPQQVEQWALAFQQQVLRAELLTQDDPKQFLRWFDWIGLQRHLKCIGIFARLNERDKKPIYLQYIPRIIRYAQSVCERYAEFAELKLLLEKRVRQ